MSRSFRKLSESHELALSPLFYKVRIYLRESPLFYKVRIYLRESPLYSTRYALVMWHLERADYNLNQRILNWESANLSESRNFEAYFALI